MKPYRDLGRDPGVSYPAARVSLRRVGEGMTKWKTPGDLAGETLRQVEPGEPRPMLKPAL